MAFLASAFPRARPIIFSAPMVRAILAGRKTQTRRVVKGKAALEWLAPDMFTPEFVASPDNHLSPYGHAGEQLWVRETWRPTSACWNEWTGVVYRADDTQRNCPYFKPNFSKKGWTPAIHMPRNASRLVLNVTGVRIERLFDLSEEDAIAEGLMRVPFYIQIPGEASHGWTSDEGQPVSTSARRAFEDLWHSINGEWLDTWVWVIDFRRAE